MQVETMLKLYMECEKVQKTVKGAECSKCPLSREVRISMEAETLGTGVLSEVRIQVNPCLLITEIAGKL